MTNLPVSSLQIPSGGSLILVVQRVDHVNWGDDEGSH